ncbi:MAG: hypothetical protein ACI7YS_03330 [Flavobacterium sp.]
MKKIILSFLLVIAFYNNSNAQVGIGTTSPQADLDIRTSNTTTPTATAGIAIPQVNNLPTLGNRAGQMVFWTTTKKYYCYDGSTWNDLSIQINTIGDVKYGFQTGDHNGWFLLNGRATNDVTLSTTQKTQAAALFTGGFLPDARDKFMKGMKASGETLTTTVGSNSTSITLIQANLPNLTLNGTTGNGTAHSHTATVTGSDGIHQHTGTTTNGEGSHDHTVKRDDILLSGVLGPDGYTIDSGSSTNISGGAHNHTFTTNTNQGAHSHIISVGSESSHTHSASVSTGGSSTPISVPTVPSSIIANTFIYLGN